MKHETEKKCLIKTTLAKMQMSELNEVKSHEA